MDKSTWVRAVKWGRYNESEAEHSGSSVAGWQGEWRSTKHTTSQVRITVLLLITDKLQIENVWTSSLSFYNSTFTYIVKRLWFAHFVLDKPVQQGSYSLKLLKFHDQSYCYSMTFHDLHLNSTTFQAWKLNWIINSRSLQVFRDLYEPCAKNVHIIFLLKLAYRALWPTA